jgi:predicted lipid-binding transport protein (Tim44 family)
MTKTFLMIATVAGVVGAGTGWVSAQTAAPAPPAKTAPHAHGPSTTPGPKAGGMGMMGGGMGHMGNMMGGMCHMGMGSADTKVEVKNVDKGVTITFTSTDQAKVARLQKMAEAMRLMHEANTQ